MESMVVATWRGVTCAWPRRRARLTACFTMADASGVRDCWTTALPPALIFKSYEFPMAYNMKQKKVVLRWDFVWRARKE